MFKDKLIFDVTEDPKLGQLKDLGEASDELVEIRNTAVEVLEHSESEEEDSALEKVDQGEVGLETTRMHRPDAPQVRAVHFQWRKGFPGLKGSGEAFSFTSTPHKSSPIQHGNYFSLIIPLNWVLVTINIQKSFPSK